MSVPFYARKYRKLAGGVGIITICGLILYERYKIKRILSKLIDTNVLDIDKKRPDYIYIKYHIYRESMKRMRKKQQDKNLINVIIQPFGKWWKTFKHSVAWRLLNIAQHGDRHERLKAVQQLARIDHLKDWDFRHLAQICDARTAVSLARLDCDNRWFVPVHKVGVVKNPKLVLSDIRESLNNLKPSNCVDHFMNKYFDLAIDKNSDIPVLYTQHVTMSRHDCDLLKESVAFLHHITKDTAMSQKFLEQGGLNTLLELKKLLGKDNESLATICKILANLSLVEDSVAHFFISGWVGILAQWQTHPDVRLQVIAAKVLANLDHDDPNSFTYPPNVYPLYPRGRTQVTPALDVVFIHGLLGGVFITWRQQDRENSELGLYGKNAFYTNESDDVFLVGETKRSLFKSGNSGTKNGSKNRVEESIISSESTIINKSRKISRKALEISDAATKELVETLEMSAELNPEWDVIFPDCPLKSVAESEGVYSVSGDKWINDDNNEEYTNCWPMDWLPEDFPNIRIIGIDYTSAVTQWSANFSKYCPCEKGQGSLDVRATYLLERLHTAGVGDNRPVVWVGHSMGGIICKGILLNSLNAKNSDIQKIAKNTKAIVFLGTPHRGSSLARWKQHIQMILSPSIEVKELEENSPKLLDMHNKFMNALKTTLSDVCVVSVAEGSPTMLTTFKFPVRIVTEESAFLNHGEFYLLKDDHLSLSKPTFRQTFLYQRLMKIIEKSMKSPPKLETNGRNGTHSRALSKSQNIFDMFPVLLYKFLTPIET